MGACTFAEFFRQSRGTPWGQQRLARAYPNATEERTYCYRPVLRRQSSPPLWTCQTARLSSCWSVRISTTAGSRWGRDSSHRSERYAFSVTLLRALPGLQAGTTETKGRR